MNFLNIGVLDFELVFRVKMFFLPFDNLDSDYCSAKSDHAIPHPKCLRVRSYSRTPIFCLHHQAV